MAQTIRLKRTNEAGKSPALADVDYGELSLNYKDGRAFMKMAHVGANLTALAPLASNATDKIIEFANYHTDAAFERDVSVAGDLTVTGNTDLNGTLDVQGNTRLRGDLQVDGDTSLNGNVQLGDDASDTITVVGTATFAEPATFTNGIIVPASGNTTRFADPVVFDTAPSFDAGFTMDGNTFTDAFKFTVKRADGTVAIGGWMLDTDNDKTN